MSAKLPTLLYGLMANIYTQGHIFSTAMPFGIDGWLKDSACANIPSIFVTLDTFHLLSGWLKEVASSNILYISVTLEVSQLLISPYFSEWA